MDFRTLALNIQQFVPDLSTIVINQRINQRYQQIMSYRDWEYLNDDITFGTSFLYNTGTSCKITNGERLVTISTTSGVSLSSTHVGWWIRFESEYQPYEISGVSTTTSGTTCRIKSNYSSTSAGLSGVSFTLFKNRYTIGTNVRDLRSIVYQDRLSEVPLSWIDRTDPNRNSTGSPEKYAIVEQNKSRGYVIIELWPVTDEDSHNLRANFKKTVANLSGGTSEPVCSPELLEAWSLYDCYKIASIKNPNYGKLIAEQKLELKDILHEEVQRDLQIASLPTKVRDVVGGNTVNDEFGLSHDVEYYEQGGL